MRLERMILYLMLSMIDVHVEVITQTPSVQFLWNETYDNILFSKNSVVNDIVMSTWGVLEQKLTI